jgi:putative membrane protein
MAPDETVDRPADARAPVLRCLLGGVLMGLANLVPGISGGTMLLAAGVYRAFVNGVAEISTLRFRVPTIITLAAIVGAAIVTIALLADVIAPLVVHHRWIMYSIFIGLTLGGVPLLWPLVRPLRIDAIVACAAGIGAMVAMAFIEPGATFGSASGAGRYVLAFLAGAAAASAMVLPGVSGAYLLLILGQYVAILTAIGTLKAAAKGRDLGLAMDAMHIVIPVGVGVLVGVVCVSNLIRMLLARHERLTAGVLLGLVLGAVVGLWPFQEGVAPAVGEPFRGDTVGLVDGALVMLETGRPIIPEDYPTQRFTPGIGQVAGSIALILAGFAAAMGVSHVGGTRKK